MHARYQLNERAAVITINGDVDGQPEVAFVPMETVAEGSPVAPSFATLANVLPTVADQINALNERLMPNARSEELRGVVTRTLTKLFQSASSATIAEATAIDASTALVMNYRSGDPALRPMTINRFANMKQAEQAEFAQRASVEQTSALVAAGRDHFDRMDDTIWSLVERRHMLLAHIRISGLTADFQRKPSAADPIAHGPDIAAVERAAAEALQRHDARRDVVKAATASLRSIVAATALACDLSMDAAYKLLTGRA